MFKWIHHLLNPHCAECRQERESNRICESCETLKTEIARLQQDNNRLLDRILNPPKPEERTSPPAVSTELRPRVTSWRVKQQMLEAEDREKARIMAQARKDGATLSTEELEKELKIAESTREAESSNSTDPQSNAETVRGDV